MLPSVYLHTMTHNEIISLYTLKHRRILQKLSDTIMDINTSIESLNSSLILSEIRKTTAIIPPMTTTSTTEATVSTQVQDAPLLPIKDNSVIVNIQRDMSILADMVEELRDQRDMEVESIPKQVEDRLQKSFEDLGLIRIMESNRVDEDLLEEEGIRMDILLAEFEKLGSMIGSLRNETSLVPLNVITTLFKAKERIKMSLHDTKLVYIYPSHNQTGRNHNNHYDYDHYTNNNNSNLPFFSCRNTDEKSFPFWEFHNGDRGWHKLRGLLLAQLRR
ncbi:Uncharacterized protein FKW44_013983, partial [Caligus rogercresseyi]